MGVWIRFVPHGLCAALFSINAGCALESFTIEGKACPCVEGFKCDEARNVCVRSDAVPNDAGTPETPRDAGAHPPDPPPPDPRPEPRDASVADAIAAMTPDASSTLHDDAGMSPHDAAADPSDAGCRVADPASCPANQACDRSTGRCASGSPLGTNCTRDSDCTSGVCATTQASGGTQSFCSELCGATADCPFASTCIPADGAGYCVRASAFSPIPQLDTASGGACQYGGTCHSFLCDQTNRVCLERCSRDADCTGLGDNCNLHVQSGVEYQFCFAPGTSRTAGASCTTDGECASGLCDPATATCAAPCCSNADCPSTARCKPYTLSSAATIKTCQAPSPNEGALVLGATCTSDLDCASEVCAPLDPANAQSPKKCSMTCCKNADCAILPKGGMCYGLTTAAGPHLAVCLPY
jgi:hypothetical protein